MDFPSESNSESKSHKHITSTNSGSKSGKKTKEKPKEKSDKSTSKLGQPRKECLDVLNFIMVADRHKNVVAPPRNLPVLTSSQRYIHFLRRKQAKPYRSSAIPNPTQNNPNNPNNSNNTNNGSNNTNGSKIPNDGKEPIQVVERKRNHNFIPTFELRRNNSIVSVINELARKQSTPNQLCVVNFTNGKIPGHSWLVQTESSPPAVVYETELLDCSTLYRYLNPDVIEEYLPLEYDQGLFVKNVEILRLNASLPLHASEPENVLVTGTTITNPATNTVSTPATNPVSTIINAIESNTDMKHGDTKQSNIIHKSNLQDTKDTKDTKDIKENKDHVSGLATATATATATTTTPSKPFRMFIVPKNKPRSNVSIIYQQYIFLLEILCQTASDPDSLDTILLALPKERYMEQQHILFLSNALNKFCELPGFDKKPKVIILCPDTTPVRMFETLQFNIGQLNRKLHAGSYLNLLQPLRGINHPLPTNIKLYKTIKAPKSKSRSKHR